MTPVSTENPPHERRIGFVAIVGRPNSGKSTFLNALLDEKVSIVSERPQTTQHTVRGIYTDDVRQVVFLDTPGIHEGVDDLSDAINTQAIASLRQADIILHLIDPTRPGGRELDRIEEILAKVSVPIIRVLTKSDLARDTAGSIYPDALAISSVNHEGFDILLSALDSHLSV